MLLLRLLLLSLVAAIPASAVTFTITPPLIVDCRNGLGRATVAWQDAGAGLVQVRVGGRSGTPLTGWDQPSSSAETGGWVTDGMLFVLINEQEMELARAVARVNCGGSVNAVESVFTTGAYFPLQAGNRWIFRVNTRFATSTYQTWTIDRSERIGEQTWYVLRFNDNPAAETRLRSDSAGRIYFLTEQGEQLWLDPTPSPDPAAVVRIQSRGPANIAGLGTFPDALQYDSLQLGLIRETGTFVRGLGWVRRNVQMLTGSSGGFVHGLDLVEARIGGMLRVAVPAPSLQLAAESLRLDVSGRQVTNCAVPCYFAACNLAPGADPPGTYKPCFQVRVGLPAAGSADIELLDASGRAVYRVTRTLPPDGARDALIYEQVPLYSVPNVPFPPGNYRVGATARLPGGEAAGSATLNIRID